MFYARLEAAATECCAKSSSRTRRIPEVFTEWSASWCILRWIPLSSTMRTMREATLRILRHARSPSSANCMAWRWKVVTVLAWSIWSPAAQLHTLLACTPPYGVKSICNCRALQSEGLSIRRIKPLDCRYCSWQNVPCELISMWECVSIACKTAWIILNLYLFVVLGSSMFQLSTHMQDRRVFFSKIQLCRCSPVQIHKATVSLENIWAWHWQKAKGTLHGHRMIHFWWFGEIHWRHLLCIHGFSLELLQTTVTKDMTSSWGPCTERQVIWKIRLNTLSRLWSVFWPKIVQNNGPFCTASHFISGICQRYSSMSQSPRKGKPPVASTCNRRPMVRYFRHVATNATTTSCLLIQNHCWTSNVTQKKHGRKLGAQMPMSFIQKRMGIIMEMGPQAGHLRATPPFNVQIIAAQQILQLPSSNFRCCLWFCICW